jgi:hypothetical protein
MMHSRGQTLLAFIQEDETGGGFIEQLCAQDGAKGLADITSRNQCKNFRLHHEGLRQIARLAGHYRFPFACEALGEYGHGV